MGNTLGWGIEWWETVAGQCGRAAYLSGEHHSLSAKTRTFQQRTGWRNPFYSFRRLVKY